MWGKLLLLAGLLLAFGHGAQPTKSLRILGLFPLNSKSHNAMIEPLVRGLAARGHRVDVYSHYPPKKPVANYRHHSLEGTVPAFVNNMSYATAAKFQPRSPQALLDAVGTPSCRLLELSLFRDLLRRPPRDYDLVIVETFIADCYLAWGRHLDAPMVGFMATPMIEWYNEPLGNPFSTAVYPSVGFAVVAPMNFVERLWNTLMNRLVEFQFSRAMSNQDRMIEELFGPGYPELAELRRDLDLLLVNSHLALEGPRPYTPAVVPVAGIHIDDEDATPALSVDVAKWLDESRDGCVYFSFGSMLKIETFPRPVLDAFYASFKKLAPVRFLLKIANPKELPPGLPWNVMTQSWFPQMQVLKHKNVKAFVTHGGLMSAQESIHSAVPMVGVPVFSDQYHNVEINVRKGIATSVHLETVDEAKFTAAVKEVLYNPSYKQKIDQMSRVFTDRPMKPLDTAIYWVEYVGRHGKRCLRSPLVDVPWWQVNLLDVYAFLFSVFLVICSVLILLFMKVWNMYRPSATQSKAFPKAKSKSKPKKER